MKGLFNSALATAAGVAIDSGVRFFSTSNNMNTTDILDQGIKLLGGALGSKTQVVTVPQYVSVRKRALSLGTKRSWKSRVDRQLRLSTYKMSVRWQSLATFDDGWGSIPLSLEWQGGTQFAPSRLYLPVYVFNLSSLPIGVSQGTGHITRPVICYRLYRTYDGSKAVYLWERVRGLNNGVAGAPDGGSLLTSGYQWQQTDNNFSDNRAGVDEWSRDWTNIRMMFTGATKRPTKVGTAVIRFTDETYGPDRNYLKTLGTSTTIEVQDSDPLDINQVEERTQYFDNWLVNKCTHPLASTKQELKQNPIHWYSHDTMLLGQETTISNDRNAVQCSKDMFLKGGEVYKGIEVSNDTIGQAKTLLQTNNQTTIPPAATEAVATGSFYNDDTSHFNASNFSQAYLDKYLMIYSHNYNRPFESTKFEGDYVDFGDIKGFYDFATKDIKAELQSLETVRPSDRTASFDIRIDSRFTYNL